MKTLADMERALQQCRRRVWMSSAGGLMTKSLDRAVQMSLFAATACLVIHSVWILAGARGPLGLTGIIVVCAAAFAVTLLTGAVQVMRSAPDFAAAAERLDKATRSHNRVAIALSLLREGNTTPFAQAAIQDGQAYLDRLKGEMPERYPIRWQPRRSLLHAIAVVALLLATTLWHPIGKPPGGTTDIGPMARIITPPGDAGGANEQQTTTTRNPPRLNRTPSADPTKTTREPRSATEKDTLAKRGKSAAGAAGGAARGKSKQSRAQSQSRSTSSGSKSAEQKDDTKRGKKKPTRDAKPRKVRALPHKDDQQNEQASSISAGASQSGGAMLPVQNPWTQKTRGNSQSLEDADDEEDVDESREGNKARGGVQPHLKDRRKTPSRELSMGLGQTSKKPGDGRGGPGQPKKSRGTASLVLGVPLPDFVKGRLLPGRTKTTKERTQPVPMPGEPAVAAAAAPRTLPEAPQSRFTTPAEFAQIVAAYLTALHAEAPDNTPTNTD